MTSEQLAIYRQFNYALLRGTTGNATQLATRNDIDRSTVFRYLNELRNLGAEITYDRQQKTFLYTNDFDLKDFFN